MANLADTLSYLGRYAEAEAMQREELEAALQSVDAVKRENAEVMRNAAYSAQEVLREKEALITKMKESQDKEYLRFTELMLET